MKQISKGGGPTKIRERLKEEFRSKYGDLDDADLQGNNKTTTTIIIIIIITIIIIIIKQYNTKLTTVVNIMVT